MAFILRAERYIRQAHNLKVGGSNASSQPKFYLPLIFDALLTPAEIVFHLSCLWFSFLNCDKISKKYFSKPEFQHDMNTIDDYLDIECVLNYFILLYFAIG